MLGDGSEAEAGVEAEGRVELFDVDGEGLGGGGGLGLEVAEEVRSPMPRLRCGGRRAMSMMRISAGRRWT